MDKEDIKLVSRALSDACCIISDDAFYGVPLFEPIRPCDSAALAEQIVAELMGFT